MRSTYEWHSVYHGFFQACRFLVPLAVALSETSPVLGLRCCCFYSVRVRRRRGRWRRFLRDIKLLLLRPATRRYLWPVAMAFSRWPNTKKLCLYINAQSSSTAIGVGIPDIRLLK